MGYETPEPGYHHAIAGAASGCLTRFIVQPLDVVKIRFQLQVEPIRKDSESKYRSIMQTVHVISKEEGISALWKGHMPAQMLSLVYGMNQFYMYIVINQYLEKFEFLKDKHKTVQFSGGALAGCTATIVTFPLDTIRTRLIAQSSNKKAYNGILDSCLTIYKRENARGFFKGLLPTLLQIAPHAGMQFWIYEIVKDFKFLPANPTDEHHHKRVGLLNSLVAGCIAGLVAKTVVYPLDLARKRMQIQGFEYGREGFGKFFRCSGMINCIELTTRTEGLMGLFKGLGPSQFKAALMTALHFTFYEQSLYFIRSFHETED